MEMTVGIGVYLTVLHILAVCHYQGHGYVGERVCKYALHSLHELCICIVDILLCLVQIRRHSSLVILQSLFVDNGSFQSITILLHSNFDIIRLVRNSRKTLRNTQEQSLFRRERSSIGCKKPSLDLDIIHSRIVFVCFELSVVPLDVLQLQRLINRRRRITSQERWSRLDSMMWLCVAREDSQVPVFGRILEVEGACSATILYPLRDLGGICSSGL